jgi:hypothetical protein
LYRPIRPFGESRRGSEEAPSASLETQHFRKSQSP